MSLAQRLMANKHFRWMPGSLFFNKWGYRNRFLVELETYAVCIGEGGDFVSFRSKLPLQGLIDLTDPATQGCLLALVREAWKNKIVISVGDGWFIVEAEGFYQDQKSAASLREALVLALEAVPDEDEALTES